MQILVVGNYCHDTLIHADAHPRRVLGGSAAYASAIFEALGADYGVIAKVGHDFEYFSQVKKKPRVSDNFGTASFVEDYRSGSRVGFLETHGEPIFARDIDRSVNVAMASAVAGEILPETLRALRLRSRYLVCDIQGLIRMFDDGGRVCHVGLGETAFASSIREIDFLKVGIEETANLNLEVLRKETRILLTQEARGCLLIDSFGETRVDGYPVEEVRDPSGAGDCFLAGFAYGLADGWREIDCVRFGNLCGALSVRQIGVPDLRLADFREALPSVKRFPLET